METEINLYVTNLLLNSPQSDTDILIENEQSEDSTLTTYQQNLIEQ
jgi:hypothetical protein